MARIITEQADLDAARQIARDRADDGAPGRWMLRSGGFPAATVQQEGRGVAVWADAVLDPGAARTLALALLEHAGRAEKVS